MTPELSPRNGNAPVAISYSTTPNENKSVRASSSLARTCSGDMYATVPKVVPGTGQVLLVHHARLRVGRSDLARRAGSGGYLRQTEIQNLGVTALGDENVRGLDVAMDYALAVRCIQCVGDLDGQTE